MTEYSYVGSELEVFRHALNWKAYFARLVERYLGDEVLEVGAGIGATTQALCKGRQSRWVCLEPDPAFAETLRAMIADGSLPACCEARAGTVADLGEGETFDSVIYIDVLEHIEDDRAELRLAAERLKTGGHVVVLSPAHQGLYTEFDRTIGHYRRYDRRSLTSVVPETLSPVAVSYLDSVGALASLGNRLLLKSGMPSERQVKVWDRWMVPLSERLDPLLRFSAGKSILGVWRRK